MHICAMSRGVEWSPQAPCSSDTGPTASPWCRTRHLGCSVQMQAQRGRSLAGFGASRTKVQVWTLPLPGSGTRGKSPGTYVPQFPSLKWARFSSESPVSCVTSLPPLFPHCLAGVCPLMSTPLPSVPLGPRRGMSEFSSYSPEKLSLHRAAEGVMGWRPLRP